MLCSKCKKYKSEKEEEFCVFCLLKKRGLPWMNQMKIVELHDTNGARVNIDDNDYLLLTTEQGSLLFRKVDCFKAEERFRGERELTK